MGRTIQASHANVADYFDLFVNRLAYTVQSSTPNPKTGRHWYYRPKDNQKRPVPLQVETLRKHLEGRVTVGLYAINPNTQRCKWVAIDADYADAFKDLLKLQSELNHDGVRAALEQSRRGGHLWIFAQKPLLASDCRIYITSLAKRLNVPVKGRGSDRSCTILDGIEIFPRQDYVAGTGYGNAIRGPLGIHRASRTRYWFYSTFCTLDAQISYLKTLEKLTEEQLSRFVAQIPDVPKEPQPVVRADRFSAPNRKEFRILEHVGTRVRRGNNYYTRCPSCARNGKDKGSDNLSISVDDPRLYICWAGCSKEQIRIALGCPIRARREFDDHGKQFRSKATH